MPITRAQLIADGCRPNPNMWIGDGWYYCTTCKAWRRHTAYSHAGEADCYEICTVCDRYHGRGRLRGAVAPAVPVHQEVS